MIQLKNTTDKQTFHIPRTVMKTNFTSGNEVKDVSITQNGTYQIVPSDGKKAIRTVNLDVDIKFDSEPYFNEGFNAGVADQKEKLESISITKNGTYHKEDGYNQIDVDVTPVLQNKEVTYITNGEYSVTPDEGYDGLDEVKVTVDIDVSNVPFRVPATLRFGESTIDKFPDNWD